MNKPPPKQPPVEKSKASKGVFERVTGGDGCEFTVVRHPAAEESATGEDIGKTQAPDLDRKADDTKVQPPK